MFVSRARSFPRRTLSPLVETAPLPSPRNAIRGDPSTNNLCPQNRKMAHPVTHPSQLTTDSLQLSSVCVAWRLEHCTAQVHSLARLVLDPVVPVALLPHHGPGAHHQTKARQPGKVLVRKNLGLLSISASLPGSFCFSAPSAAVFGAGAFVTLLFFTNDWKGRDLLQFIPWYNRRYDSKEE